MYKFLLRHGVAACFMLFTFISFGQPTSIYKPISTAATVKIIEADEIRPFFQGIAVVKRGDLFGAIDRWGNFLLPYGRYEFPATNKYSNENYLTNNYSFFSFKEISSPTNRTAGFITHSGKVVKVPGISDFLTIFNKQGKALAYSDKSLFLIDSTGKKQLLRSFIYQYGDMPYFNLDISTPFPTFQQDIGSPGGKPLSKMQYVDYVSRKVLVPPSFDLATPFSEGMAAVMIRDNFGQPKWGYINTSGEWKVKPTFSTKPLPFTCGLAKVEPVDRSEYSSAFIDPSGTIRIKISTAEYSSSDNRFPAIEPFHAGYTYFRSARNDDLYFVVDTLGTILPLENVLSKWQIPLPEGVNRLRIEAIRNGEMYVSSVDGLDGILAIDLRSKRYQWIQANTAWQQSGAGFGYDPFTGLRYIRRDKGVRQQQQDEEGFVNQDNEFVILINKKKQ